MQINSIRIDRPGEKFAFLSPRPVLYLTMRNVQRKIKEIVLSVEGVLESNNFDRRITVEVVTSLSHMKKACDSVDRAILVYSFMTPHISEVWNEIRLLKRFSNKLFFLAGGPHASGAPDETLAMGFDTVITGPGEAGLASALHSILDDPEPFRHRVIRLPADISLDIALPVSRLVPFIPPLEIMRGCSCRCAFCQTGMTQKPVFRSLESISKYVEILVQRNLLQRNGFICPSGLEYGSAGPGRIDLSRIEALLDTAKSAGIIHLEYGIFPSEIHPRTMNEAGLKLIRKYCSNKKITIGAQSGSDRLLKKLRRGHTIEDIETACALAVSQGFRPILDFIIGFPGETDDDRAETLRWTRKLHARYGARIQMHYFLPLAGSALYDAVPALPDRNTQKTLDHFFRGGICTQWWRSGFDQSWDLIKTRRKLQKIMPGE